MSSFCKHAIVAFTCLVLASGCATDSSQSNSSSSQGRRSLKDILPNTVGLPESKLYAAFGAPTKAMSMQNGGKVIEFVERHSIREFTGTRVESSSYCGPEEHRTAGTMKREPFSSVPAYEIEATTTTKRNCLDMNTGVRPTYSNIEKTCHITFILDRSGIVSSYNYKGDLC